MGRITVNRTMAQFSCKISITPELWNPRESRLNGKSKEAVEVNAKIDKLLLAVNSAFDSLVERKTDFDATAVKEAFQGSKGTRMTLLKLFDRHIGEVRARVGIDVSHRTLPNYLYTAAVSLISSAAGSKYQTLLSASSTSSSSGSFRNMS